ncbi:prepilin peptidase [Candidatus Desantisbacteria bacterium]|nr:prepilin peptidase [Candidatus Desantisbacteria bacterium]
MTILTYLLIFIIGTMLGSFFNVCIYRLPRGQGLLFPGSHCPACNAPIKPWENIPILSYILLKGRCSRCKEKISGRYILVEFICGLLYLGLFLRFGLGTDFFVFLFFVSVLVIITFIDFEHFLILDKITYPSMIIGLIACLIKKNLIDSMIGLLVGAGIIFLIVIVSAIILKMINHPCKDEGGMGFGDVKLAGVMGVFLGWKFVLVAMFLACLFGSIVGMVLILSGLKKRTDYIPFGPYLALGSLAVVLWGEEILGWYIRLLG